MYEHYDIDDGDDSLRWNTPQNYNDCEGDDCDDDGDDDDDDGDR